MHLRDVLAPAKLNLFLHITGRRPDGYHLLQSVFVLIDWCDVLHFETRPRDARISREDLGEPLPAEDLIVRAARVLQQATGCRQGAHIQIDKRIPSQAGMGGGSSDAASTLMALNRLWGLHLAPAQLQAIGLQLGADVPFFLGGHNAWVEGIGEAITPLEGEAALPPARFLVVKPPVGLATAEIFSHPALQRETDAATISRFTAAAYGFGRNDLQPVAELICPPVKKVIDWLNARGFHARMTGSGSAVFARIPEDFSSLQLQEIIADAEPDWLVRICQGLSVHPMWDRAENGF
ncbi:4-(cytidine 5'-diphospho)-2-C-methyl-D-erythritol kinase [Corticibacter populi]|uniref:4-diphosphocytidyl-2-C-methyl-D-erythritol kinase n=1 Tax=Corticibacter populi TaxID=1550736 RepID=A0A3M6QTN0_9BURK|nr:4-(cytidine 5'-diphospho)-2-C-methyl-D-erythritol kinase [Corticibacter populi]RMX06380.1 4-(cytidine 5'-diphospho)-2-C-methyl-D-erythritol kinase [Corticibacter populi]